MAPAAAPLFVIVAGEESGDALAAGLIKALAARWPGARFAGVTGPRMRAAGCESMADVEALSLFGISEIIGQIPRLLRLRRHLHHEIRRRAPAVFIGVDAPAFNTRLEINLRRAGIRTVHYVCPTVWAWREGRVRHIRRAVDRLLAIFPFEPAYFARHGIEARFVGHPLADALPVHPDADTARAALDLPAAGPLVGLLPGSRGAEVRRLMPRLLATARWLTARRPDLVFVVPAANPRMRALIDAVVADAGDGLSIVMVDGRAREVMRAVDVLLLASGTATLEGLLAKTPMVVTYELSQANYWLARGLDLIKTDVVSMPNLLAGYRLVPELLQHDANIAALGAWVLRLLADSPARQRQIEAFDAIHETLARDADARAAEAVSELVDDSA
ncbi:lipid-A-disaccharide synthase [Salinisphaera sp. Q1T1-3]|uniref:lipid-A-disaccharide synthase n=1 Tax=Salinisphaera sp. Q1T1-3 TaxID=2321229 RepID=UPI000E71BAB5|nr:lipid-A-disaccharide synthase [Salinisphaera sp. Q1T1-3]RJS95415.1 lipid-A-disaccharide synthase [Salinisphaera sp. Q1T1-3]